MEYFICISSNAEGLEEVVNHQIKKGWLPQGGVCVARVSDTTVKFYQAMVRPSTPDIPARPEPPVTEHRPRMRGK